MSDIWSLGIQRLLSRVNSFYRSGSSKSKCKLLLCNAQQIGWIREDTANQLRQYPNVFIEQSDRFILSDHLNTYENRSEAIDKVLNDMRAKDSLKTLRGWRDELYLVKSAYSNPPLFAIERAAASAFGIRKYGAHLNGYVIDDDGTWRMWIGKRSKTKQTFPGMYDNLAAGGLSHDLTPTECMIKECGEEAQIPKELVVGKLKSVGAISNTYEDEDGIHVEGEFIYDLQLPTTFQPNNSDAEMENFYLWTIPEVKEAIIKDDFKPNCGIVVLDFLIRHGFVTPEQESNYFDILSQIHMPGH
ncbi:unnamed protein product [Adineta steineri]|uniref:Nudix hydrolase domain-containing protein n=1 Tax=Adineta steineri TaxID=433720 RepID=A0A815HNS6_9BILA|nr:unnamed protein product [Adineta steineri]